MLGVLAGSKRHAHIAGVRGDAVAVKALRLKAMVGEDSVRRALKAMAPEASEPWLRQALMASVRHALDRPWVLDMDATIKPLYGRQEGAEMGYNPHKPGRPSHVLHTFWVGTCAWCLTRCSARVSDTARAMPRRRWPDARR